MGYISDLNLIMYKEDYEALKGETEKFQEHYGFQNFKPFWDMENGKIVSEVTRDGHTYIHYQTDVKMYGFENDCYNHEDIDWFNDFVKARGIPYVVVRFGEEVEDVEVILRNRRDDNFYDLIDVRREVRLEGNDNAK